ncbi:MAG: hypothetical protein ACTH2J_05390 [Candidatus Microbacterium stercoravium]
MTVAVGGGTAPSRTTTSAVASTSAWKMNSGHASATSTVRVRLVPGSSSGISPMSTARAAMPNGPDAVSSAPPTRVALPVLVSVTSIVADPGRNGLNPPEKPASRPETSSAGARSPATRSSTREPRRRSVMMPSSPSTRMAATTPAA